MEGQCKRWLNLSHSPYVIPMSAIWWKKSHCEVFLVAACPVCTCRYLLDVTMGTHCIKRLLQQPEQRCTSTQGGHKMKLALRRSNIDLFTSITSVRTLQTACWAGCASTGSGEEKEALFRRNGTRCVKRQRNQLSNLPRLLAYRPWVWSVRVSCSSSSSSAEKEVDC